MLTTAPYRFTTIAKPFTSEWRAFELFANKEKPMSITGECFCGEISYQVTGKLGDTTSCHCSRCRKAFSSQASASALVQPSQFTWLKGESLLSTYSSAQDFGLQFCRLCGSTLCTIYKGEVFQIMLGCLNGSPDIEIGKHIYVGSKAKWEVMPSDVTQFDKGP